MLCERCKIREANIQYTEVINGVRTEHHFCAQCARELDFGQYSASFDGEFPLAKLLSGLLGSEEPAQDTDRLQQIQCPSCGMTYEEFVENSCFGCADCYGVFDVLIHENIKKLQGSDSHKGKRPLYQGLDAGAPKEEPPVPVFERDETEEAIRAWNRKLKEALKNEEYETAAVCRDKIRELKEGKKSDDKMV